MSSGAILDLRDGKVPTRRPERTFPTGRWKRKSSLQPGWDGRWGGVWATFLPFPLATSAAFAYKTRHSACDPQIMYRLSQLESMLPLREFFGIC